MGMTINEAKQNIKTYAMAEAEKLPIQVVKSFDMAIDTMRKYQKIVDIVTDDYGYPSNLRKIMDIREVVEDATN